MGDSVLPFHRVGEKNVVLIGTDDLIDIRGTHISSIAIGSSAEIDPRRFGCKSLGIWDQ